MATTTTTTTPAPNPKPAIILIPGAWHHPIHLAPLATTLRNAGPAKTRASAESSSSINRTVSRSTSAADSSGLGRSWMT
ncbi:hypothetical protein MAPG_08717 [Magnaporthiopsis poae ATCC 64411]|uniref:Uncharacterized protein n=1 Tax=Magnaporthiopsis poae (strain ATCC 64411 / 73-15) TaxID=644358 RepID=A0A0C4E830_MAGP6|nr:hypothetical protein MAPG_08717 [Magnaporthiopsis poae ATCC 64411]